MTPSIALALSFFGTAHAFWRMNCAVVQTGRIDPIVNPGTVAGHVHTIVGGSNIGVNATFDSLLNSECTSCEIAADKSAYWTPLLYYQYENGSFTEVPHDGSVVYYLGRGPNVNSTVPFPKGFQMLSGDISARSFDNTTMTWGNAQYPGRPVADRVSFNCLDTGPALPERPYMWRTQCANGLRAQIQFQSCWNGADLYKPDQSHVAYLSAIDNGVCPPTHPVQLPHLFMETLYAVANVPGQTSGGRFVFAMGDTTGYGFHADFQNGWDVDVQANAVANCLATDNAGQISACPALQASQTSSYRDNCQARPPQVQEKVFGLLDKLPGCITITDGPDKAPPASMNCAASVAKPVVAQTVDSVPLPTAQPTSIGQSFGLPNNVYLGCFNDLAGEQRTLNAVSYSNRSVMSVEFCQQYCTSRGYRLSGVEYTAECYCGNAVNPRAVGGSNECNWRCGAGITNGGTQQICGGYGYISVYNNTDSNFTAIVSPPSSNPSNPNPPSGNAPPPPKVVAQDYLGCYSDNVPGTRTLANGAFVDWKNMTVPICAAYCQTGNNGISYQYYGVEYATECFCSNFISSGAKLLTATSNPPNTTCSARCGGSADQVCGGSSVVSVYNNTLHRAPTIKSSVGQYYSKGCLTDPNTSGRALQGASTASTAMTVDSCIKFCLGKKMRYAGVEYGSECFCDTQIRASSGVKAQSCDATQMQSLMMCSGDKTTYCGGPSLLNYYYSSS